MKHFKDPEILKVLKANFRFFLTKEMQCPKIVLNVLKAKCSCSKIKNESPDFPIPNLLTLLND